MKFGIIIGLLFLLEGKNSEVMLAEICMVACFDIHLAYRNDEEIFV